MSAIDYSQEPEKIWKASLLKHQNEAFYFLFVLADYSKAWELMRGWIGTLSLASHSVLKTLKAELNGTIFEKRHISPQRSYEIFDELSQHSYQCYLSQAGFGMVQTAAIEGKTKPPNIKIKKREKATL